MFFAGLFAQFAASPLGETSRPGRGSIRHRAPLGARIDIALNCVFQLLSIRLAISWWLLGSRFAFAWYLLGNVAACLEDCLAFVRYCLGSPLEGRVGLGMLERLL